MHKQSNDNVGKDTIKGERTTACTEERMDTSGGPQGLAIGLILFKILIDEHNIRMISIRNWLMRQSWEEEDPNIKE